MSVSPAYVNWNQWRHAVEALPWTEGQRRVLAGRLPLHGPSKTLEQVAEGRVSRARIHQVETSIRNRLTNEGLLDPLRHSFRQILESRCALVLESITQNTGWWHGVDASVMANALGYTEATPDKDALRWRAVQGWNGNHLLIPCDRRIWDAQVDIGRTTLERALKPTLGLSEGMVQELLDIHIPPLGKLDDAERQSVAATFEAIVIAPMITGVPLEERERHAQHHKGTRYAAHPVVGHRKDCADVWATGVELPLWVMGINTSASEVVYASLRWLGGEGTVSEILSSVPHLKNPGGDTVDAAPITLRTRLTAGVKDGSLIRVSKGHYRLAHVKRAAAA